MSQMRLAVSISISGLALICGCSSSVPGSTSDPKLASLQVALAGHPDAATQAAMATLATALSAEDWGYLTYAQWPNDGGQAALTDPTLRKALAALTTGKGQSVTAQSLPEQTVHLQNSPGVSEIYFVPATWEELFKNSFPLLVNANGLDFAGTPAAFTAWADLLTGALTNKAGTPLPDPTQAADGHLDGCGKYFYDTSGPPIPTCSSLDFCCRGDLDYDSGRTICNDFTSCRGEGGYEAGEATAYDATEPGMEADIEASDAGAEDDAGLGCQPATESSCNVSVPSGEHYLPCTGGGTWICQCCCQSGC